ncbi:MAG TPA: sigma factor, partial [Gammaproteobacteria bacterium]
MGTTAEMEQFLADVEKRAFRIARFAVGNHDDALEIVQEAMIKLVQRYANSPREEWPPLFYRILESRIRDHQRRQKVRDRIHTWFGFGHEDEEENPIEALPARA